MPSIVLSGTSVIKSLIECHTISCLAKLSTVLSIVSTEVALALTKSGECLKAESKLSYLIFINVLAFAIGVKLSLASQTKASEPSDPVINRLKSNSVKSSLKTCSKSYPVKKRFNRGNFVRINSLFSPPQLSSTCLII